MKKLIKWLMPSSKKLSKMAADKIQNAINQSGKEDIIAKYATMADSATEIQKWVTELLVDGKIDDIEKSDIAERLQPLIQKVVDLI